MLEKEDYEYLRTLPYLGISKPSLDTIIKSWYSSDDTVLTVARILDAHDIFGETKYVIYYFEKPWKWEHDIQELIKEYEKQRTEVLNGNNQNKD